MCCAVRVDRSSEREKEDSCFWKKKEKSLTCEVHVWSNECTSKVGELLFCEGHNNSDAETHALMQRAVNCPKYHLRRRSTSRQERSMNETILHSAAQAYMQLLFSAFWPQINIDCTCGRPCVYAWQRVRHCAHLILSCWSRCVRRFSVWLDFSFPAQFRLMIYRQSFSLSSFTNIIPLFLSIPKNNKLQVTCSFSLSFLQ